MKNNPAILEGFSILSKKPHTKRMGLFCDNGITVVQAVA